MDGNGPQQKKIPLEEVSQCFEGLKIESSSDDDSLLIEVDDEHPQSKNFNTSKTEIQIQIDEISSGLEKIEAYLRQQDEPLEKLEKQISCQLTQNNLKKNYIYTIDFKPEMRTKSEKEKEDDKNYHQFKKNKRMTLNNFIKDEKEKRDLISSSQLENQLNNQSLAPIKMKDRFFSNIKIFLPFKKQNPQPTENFDLKTYLMEAPKRLQQKRKQNKQLVDLLTQIKQELNQTEQKISDVKQRLSRQIKENQYIKKRTQLTTQYLNSLQYQKDLQFVRNFEIQNTLKIVKCQITQTNCSAHVIFDDIFLKIKSKSKYGPTEIKFMDTRQVKQNKKFFIFKIQLALEIIQKNHPKQQRHFIQSILKVRKSYEAMQNLDSQIYYLSLVFKLESFQINQKRDKLSFRVFLYLKRSIRAQINLGLFLANESNESVSLFDQKYSIYLEADVNIKEGDNILMEKITKIIDKCIMN